MSGRKRAPHCGMFDWKCWLIQLVTGAVAMAALKRVVCVTSQAVMYPA